jgi:hypothetical protein
MPKEYDMICERCGKHQATHHITRMFGGEQSITTNICASCFQKDPSFAKLARKPDLTELIRTGKCNYCGAPPDSGSVSSGVGGPDVVHLCCEQCRKDLEGFFARPENQPEVEDDDVSSMSDDEFSARMSRLSDQRKEREKRKDQFMRMKVAQRRSGSK